MIQSSKHAEKQAIISEQNFTIVGIEMITIEVDRDESMKNSACGGNIRLTLD